LLWGLLRARLLRGLRLLVGCYHLLMMGWALITLLLTHVVVHEVILCRRLVIVVRMLVLMIRLHMVWRSLLVIRMLLRMVMILVIVIVERCL
jgi:hypothetical protein